MSLKHFRESFKKLLDETPAMLPTADIQVGIAPTDQPVPEINADEEMNICTLECDLFKKVLEYCGANSAMADNIVQQSKLLGKSINAPLTIDHFDDIVGASQYELPVTSPQTSPEIGAQGSMANPSVANAPVMGVTESVVKEDINDETGEKFEVVETEEEIEENKEE